MKEKLKTFLLHALRLTAALFVIATIGSAAIVAAAMLARYVWNLILYGFNYFA